MAKPTQGGALTKRAGSERTTGADASTSTLPPTKRKLRKPSPKAAMPERAAAAGAALATVADPASHTPARPPEKEASADLVAQTGEVMPATLTGYASLTPEVLRGICDAMENGITMRLAADLAGVNYQTLCDAKRHRPDLAVPLIQAQARSAMKWLERGTGAVADGRSARFVEYMLEKIHPKAFSARLVEEEAANEAPVLEATVTHTTEAGIEPEADPSDEDAMIMAKALLAHRQAKQAAEDAAAKGDDDGLE